MQCSRTSFLKQELFPLDILNSPQNKTHAINLAHCCSYSMQCPEGGAVLREALLCPSETEGGISSQPEHSTHSSGGAVSVPTGGSAAGAQKIPQCQRYVYCLQAYGLYTCHHNSFVDFHASHYGKVYFSKFCLVVFFFFLVLKARPCL